MYEVNYYVVNDKFNIDKKILNTKQLYCKYHPNFDIKSFNKFPKHFVKKIVKKDTVICFDSTLIFKKLYTILALIDNTNILTKFITTRKYERHIKANSNITSQINMHKNFMYQTYNSIKCNGEHRVNWHFLNNLKKEKKITNFFIQSIVLGDPYKISSIYDKKEQDKTEKIFHFYENRLTQKTTQKAVLKSLGILLHYEFKHHLKIGDTKSKELITDMMASIYNTKGNDDEFNRHIYLASTVSLFPIFGAKKSKHFIKREKDIIKNLLIKDMRKENKDIKINYSDIDLLLEQHLETQHIEYLKKQPIELLKINEKYSHLISHN